MHYQAEHYSHCFRELESFHVAHWQEVEGFQDKIPLDVDHDAFCKMDQSGALAVITARDEGGVLQGYALWQASVNPKHQGTRMAANISFYVKPEARGHWVGKRLLAESERWLRMNGVKLTDLCVKNGHDDLGKLAGLEGYRAAETHWQKWIGD